MIPKNNTVKKNKRPQILNRVRAFTGIFIVTAALIVSLPLVSSTPAYAAVTTAASKKDDFDWQIKSFLYYRAIARCMKVAQLNDTFNNKISSADAKSGKWLAIDPESGFSGTANAAIGVYMRDATTADAMDVGADGTINCNNDKYINAALTHWGLKSKYKEVLCHSNLRVVGIGADQTVAKCTASSGDYERREGGSVRSFEKFTAYIKDTIYGGDEPSLTDPQWYTYYLHTLQKSCIVGIETRAPNTSERESDSNERGYNDVNWVKEDEGVYSVVTGSYTGTSGWKKDTDVVIRPGAGSEYLEFKRNCAAVVGLMNPYAEAYKNWANINKAAAEAVAAAAAAVGDPEDDAVTCSIESVGWIVCPALTFVAKAADGAFVFLADSFLKTDTSVVDTTSPTYKAWAVMRNIANVAFVLAFLLIIFSQLTNFGVSNYGVKKMLPRIVIAALLVNVSFFVCQIAVDLSNILGYSLKDLFGAITTQATGTSSSALTSPFTGADPGENTFAFVTGSILAIGVGSVVLYSLLGTLIPVLLAALVALITILFILVARQALIILLVVVSPLAFVAYLLPNTEAWFKKWRQAFTALLLVFPIIAVVFGVSTLASGILSATFNGTLNGATGGESNFFGQIIGAAVMILPLFVVPSLLKKSLDGIPAIGAMANKLASRSNGKLSNAVGESYNNSLAGRGAANRKASRQNYRDKRYAKRLTEGPLSGANNVIAGGVPGALSRIPGVKKLGNTPLGILTAQRQGITRSAEGAAEKIKAEEASEANKTLGKMLLEPKERRAIAHGNKISKNGYTADGGSDSAARHAAIQQIVANNDVEGMAQLWDQSGSWDDATRAVFADSLQGSSGRPIHYGQGAIAALRTNSHTKTNDGAIRDAVLSNAYSADKVAASDKDEMLKVSHVTKDMEAGGDVRDVAAVSQLRDNTDTALTDPILSAKVSKNKEFLEAIESGAEIIETRKGHPNLGNRRQLD